MTFAAEHRKAIEFRAVAEHLPSREMAPRVQIEPSARRQRDLNLAARLDDGRDEQRIAAHELRFEMA